MPAKRTFSGDLIMSGEGPAWFVCQNCKHNGQECPYIDREYCCEKWIDAGTGKNISQSLGLTKCEGM